MIVGVRGGEERGRGMSKDENNEVMGFRMRLCVDSNSFLSMKLSDVKLIP